jgi:hypothetical protein
MKILWFGYAIQHFVVHWNILILLKSFDLDKDLTFKHHFKHLRFSNIPNAQIGKAFWKYLKCFPFIPTIFHFVKVNFLTFNLPLYLVWFCHKKIFKKSIYSLEMVMSPIKLRTLQHSPIFNPFINTIGCGFELLNYHVV